MNFPISNPQFPVCNPRSRGFTYVALLVAIIIIGISMGAAGKYWSFVMQREREEELLFRGEQYRQAIERYYLARLPNTLPPSIDELLSDSRFPQAKRHLRKKYPDPVTGADFEVIRDLTRGNRIVGVYSTSEKEPFKKTDFPVQYQSFENKMTYNEWKFIFTVTPTPGQPGQTGAAQRMQGRPPLPATTK